MKYVTIRYKYVDQMIVLLDRPFANFPIHHPESCIGFVDLTEEDIAAIKLAIPASDYTIQETTRY